MRNQKRKRLFPLEPGFTLIELLVTSLAVGLILTIGLANYTRIRRQQAFHQAVKNVLADMRLAQDKAISGEKPTDCRPTSPPYYELIGYQFEFSDTGDSYQIRALCQGLEVEPLYKEETIASDVIKTSGPDSILFQVLTRGVDLDNPSETFTFTDSSGSWSENIVITESGEIYPSVGPTASPG